MSYTAPAGNAADFNFTSGAYAVPDGDRADLSFETGVLRAKSIASTRFGTGLALNNAGSWLATNFGTPLARLTVLVSGWSSTEFGPDPRLTRLMPVVGSAGAPAQFGTPTVTYTATGFSSTALGLANSPYLQVGDASGDTSTAFGSPRLTTVCRAVASAPSTVFSAAYYAFAQTVVAAGGSATSFGTPVGTRVATSGGVLCRAEGSTSTGFGAPAATWHRAEAASGFSTTALGTPTGFLASTRFATGFSRTRLGKPKGMSRFDVRYASSVAVTTSFGDHSSATRNRITSIEPPHKFGTPTLLRSTTC